MEREGSSTGRRMRPGRRFLTLDGWNACPNTNDHTISHMQSTGWQQVPGFAAYLGVSTEGTPWVADSTGFIYQ